MLAIAAKVIPVLVTIGILAAMAALVMGVGWISGILIRKSLGIGGK